VSARDGEMTLRERAVGLVLLLSLGLPALSGYGWLWLAVLSLGWPLLRHQRGLRDYYRKLDRLLYAGESTVAVLALLAMTTGVFLDVVWRTSHGDDIRWSLALLAAVLALCALGARAGGHGAVRSLLCIGGVCLAGAGAHLAPNGCGWSQRLALVLMLWVGMLGASMATRNGRQIRLDAVRRALPESRRRAFQIAGDLLTLGFVSTLALLALRYVEGNFEDFANSEGRRAVFSALPVPYFAATLPIAIAFGLIAARSVRDVLCGPPSSVDQGASESGGSQ